MSSELVDAVQKAESRRSTPDKVQPEADATAKPVVSALAEAAQPCEEKPQPEAVDLVRPPQPPPPKTAALHGRGCAGRPPRCALPDPRSPPAARIGRDRRARPARPVADQEQVAQPLQEGQGQARKGVARSRDGCERQPSRGLSARSFWPSDGGSVGGFRRFLYGISVVCCGAPPAAAPAPAQQDLGCKSSSTTAAWPCTEGGRTRTSRLLRSRQQGPRRAGTTRCAAPCAAPRAAHLLRCLVESSEPVCVPKGSVRPVRQQQVHDPSVAHVGGPVQRSRPARGGRPVGVRPCRQHPGAEFSSARAPSVAWRTAAAGGGAPVTAAPAWAAPRSSSSSAAATRFSRAA